jgi:hypothetical protein
LLSNHGLRSRAEPNLAEATIAWDERQLHHLQWMDPI